MVMIGVDEIFGPPVGKGMYILSRNTTETTYYLTKREICNIQSIFFTDMRAIRSAILGMTYFYYLGFHSLNFPCIYILPILGSWILHKTHGRIGAYGTVAV